MCCFAYAVGALGFLRSRWSIMGVLGVLFVDREGSGVGGSLVEYLPCGSNLPGYTASQCRLAHLATLSTCAYARVH